MIVEKGMFGEESDDVLASEDEDDELLADDREHNCLVDLCDFDSDGDCRLGPDGEVWGRPGDWSWGDE